MIRRIFDILGIILWLISIILIIVNYDSLPNKIPSHYNLSGEPDSWGTKAFVFALPAIAIVVWIALHIINRSKKLERFINVPSMNGKPNRAQIDLAKILLDVMKFEMMAIFTFLIVKDLYTAKGMPFVLGFWEPFIILGIICITVVIYLFNNYKLDQEKI